ncbi:MAG: LLM class flavin-dependent oxidoreductase [Rhodothermales bacterium]
MENSKFSCYLIGSESLLIQCAGSIMSAGHEILGVVSNAPRIRDWAESQSLKVIDSDVPYAEVLAATPFDYLLSITNLSIIAEEALSLPRVAAINFHDGPLPDYAGLNVTTWALADGVSRHAVSWHLMKAAVDEGDVLVEEEISVADGETAFSLNTKCYEAGISSFGRLLEMLEERRLAGREQTGPGQYFGRYHRPPHGGVIDFEQDADSIARLVRSLDFGTYDNPVATAKMKVPGGFVSVGKAEVLAGSAGKAGHVVSVDKNSVVVGTSSNDVRLSSLHSIGDDVPQAADLSMALFPGDQLKAFAVPDVERLAQIDTTAARHDHGMVRALLDPQPAIVPYAEARVSAGQVAVDTVELLPADVPTGRKVSPAVSSAAVVAAFLAKLCNQARVDLRIAASPPEDEMAGLYRASSLARFDFGSAETSVGELIGRATKRLSHYQTFAGHSGDLLLRYPRLREAEPFETVELSFAEDAAQPSRSAVLAVTVSKDGRIWFVMRADLLDTDARARLVSQFRHFSTYAARNPEQKFGSIGLLDRDTYKQIVETWNRTSVSYEPASIHRQFRTAAERAPDELAIVTQRERLTYSELDRRSTLLSHLLRKRGVKRGDRVGICSDRSSHLIVGVLGILKTGAAYVPLDPDFPRERLHFISEDAAVADLLCLRRYRGLFSDQSREPLVLDEVDWNLPATYEEPATDKDDLAYVIHTSGSTGAPKGVMVRHRNVANFFVAMDEVLQPDGGTWLAVTSLSFDISVLELLWTLTRGYKVVLGSPVKPTREDSSLPHREQPIDFSLFFFAASSSELHGQRDQYRLLLESTRFADEHGFVAIWSPERHFHSFGGLYPNSAVTNAALATISSNVRLRAGSLVSPLHHPVRMAEEWAMVDNLSGGRVDISFAAGWQPNDFLLQPANWERRKEIMFEQIEVVQRLWRGEAVEFPKADGKNVSVRTLPRPVQQELPVWITAAGNPETFRLGAENGYNVLTHLLGQSVEELAEKIALYRDTQKAKGLSGGKITLMLHTFIGDSVDSVREIVRDAMKAYLGTAMNLVKEAAWTFPTFKEMTMTNEGRFSMEHLSDGDRDAILDYAFERYFESSGLFGSVETCAPFVDRLKEIGVDEIGCLVDFGVDTELVLSSLPELARLLKESNPVTTAPVTAPVTGGDGYGGSSAPFVVGRTAAEAESAISMYELAIREGVTHLQCTPSMARMLVADPEGREVLGRLQHFLVGGEALDTDLARQIKELAPGTVTNMYGPTETTVWSTSYEVTGSERSMPIGRPLANNTVYVLGRDGSPVPTGVTGELFIGGDGVTAGYLNRSDLTDERFVPDPFSPRGGRMYRTGDLCRFTEDGLLQFLGRNDHQVKVRGYRIELDEIEKALRQLDSVAETAVVVERRTTDPVIVAYVVETADGSFEQSAARQRLDRQLPPYMVPSQFVVLASFPRTPNGKLDRNALAKQTPKSRTTEAKPAATVAPESDLETTIAGVWKDVLEADSVGVTDNFFDIGGHSLLAVQVNARLSEVLGQTLSLIDLFRYPTIRTFAAHLAGNGESEENSAVARGSSRAEARRAAMNRRGR